MLVLLFFFLSSHSSHLSYGVLLYVWMELLYVWNDGWNLFMYEMMDGTCLCMKWCMNLFMWWMPVKYIYMSYIFSVQIVGFNKKQKKQTICRLFAVCHRRQRALCRPPRTAKKPRGSQLCFLGADPFGQFAYSGRRQRLCRPGQTAKNLHFAISGRRQRTCHLVTCRWHHKADGKDQRILPSAADGKGLPLAT